MSKRAEALKTLAYLKQEEAYIANLRNFLSDQIFKLQIDEMKLSALLRQKKLELQRQQLKKANVNSHEETLPCTLLPQPMNPSITPLQSPSVAPPLPKTDIIPNASNILEPLNLEPDITMESNDDEED
ncbi:hypothetical protein JTE90_011054 [Oedothorax gibbosus]|uniref:Uncharacterized protein n=1 Tax=Oedothorax gibbosus TaxID=931172 RepID=A0AAV6VCF1_9ARAC|nr:hypothetical protein JTE90_011054 [Oedothorax gibbosus]